MQNISCLSEYEHQKPTKISKSEIRRSFEIFLWSLVYWSRFLFFTILLNLFICLETPNFFNSDSIYDLAY